MINSVLDRRYEILERVGGGGMADVYRAHDMLLDRYVAVKILHAQFANDEEFVTKFRREAQGAAKLSHPNIVNIYDVGQDENKYYIIMEYVSGETLKEMIRRKGNLSVKESLRIAREIGEALEHAHHNNLVHCDIKPHNILVMENGRIKVTDFGIARAATSSTMTYSDNIIGSVHYFSPEQARGSAINPQSDIYSLGVVLYEMLTGAVPFSGENPVSIALKHLQEEPIHVSKLNNSIPALVEAIVIKAMEKDIENRFKTIKDMIRDIHVAEDANWTEQSRQGNDEFATKVLPAIRLGKKANNQNNIRHSSVMVLLKSRKTLGTLIGILVLGFLLGAFLSYGKFWSNNEVKVPDVVGKTTAVAQELLESENLRVHIVETFDADVQLGQVISQYPEAGAVVKEQRPITIYISKGGEAVEVPDIRGLSRRDAELKLKNNGLKLGKVDDIESDEPFDTVLNQTPRAAAQATKGYAIDIVISRGAKVKKIELPDFKGSSVSTIETQLKSLGLKLGKITEVADNKAAPGTILSQSPEAGKEVLAETAIDLTVAKADSAKRKTTKLELTVPDGADKQVVRIVVTDANGRRTAYENVHQPGDKIVKTLDGQGDLRLQIYINGNLVQEKTI